jgi:hypothetical protein
MFMLSRVAGNAVAKAILGVTGSNIGQRLLGSEDLTETKRASSLREPALIAGEL